jgi:hypothetical protein
LAGDGLQHALNLQHFSEETFDGSGIDTTRTNAMQTYASAQTAVLVGANPDRVIPLSYEPIPAAYARSELIAEWHGQVNKLFGDSFVAELTGVFGQSVAGSHEEAVIPLDGLKEDDLELVRPGAFFRLCVSYETAPTGTRRHYTEVTFRRLPAYRREDIEDAARETADIVRAIRVE